MLDQIPRLDFCELLVGEDSCFDSSVNIVPVARFSLVSLLNSQKRVYKAKLYDSGHIARLIKLFEYQDEAFLFTFKGMLYCDSFSSRTGTKEYGRQHSRLNQKSYECDDRLASLNRIIELEEQGFQPQEIVRKVSKNQFVLPRGRKRKNRKNQLDDWDEDVLECDASDEEVATHELHIIMKEHGSWDNYIKAIKQDVEMEQTNKAQYERELKNYSEKVSNVIHEVKSSPFTILGC